MDATTALPLRAELVGGQPYGAPELDVPVRLNVNENPYPPSPAVVEAVTAAVRDVAARLNRYPDREVTTLRTALAGYLGHGLTAEQVWAGNGSNEVMLHVLQAFGGAGRCVLSFTPTYSMYPEYARATGTRLAEVPRRSDFTIDVTEAVRAIASLAPSVVFVASPNNPSGTETPLATVEAICVAARDSVVVVDEAYAEFRPPGVPSALTMLDVFANLAVARTMSKAFALAGARVGYLAAGQPVVDALRLVRLPYHLSSLTQAVAAVALTHADETLHSVAELRAERDRLLAWLRARGHDVADSTANFVLVRGLPDPHGVWTRLVERGVLVRESSVPNSLRISVGTPDEMQAFRAAWTLATDPSTQAEGTTT